MNIRLCMIYHKPFTRWLVVILLGLMPFHASFITEKKSAEPSISTNTQPNQETSDRTIPVLENHTLSVADWAGYSNEKITKESLKETIITFESLQNCLYYAPYFIFQATYSEKSSDFYLYSLNTQTGDLETIHKGYHGSFWIQGKRLVFRHTDYFFSCPVGKWNQIAELRYPINLNKDEKLYENRETDLPKALQSIDWKNIHCIRKGSFTQPGLDELLIISGRKPTYDIAVFQWKNHDIKIVEYLGKNSNDLDWLKISSTHNEPMVNFRQAIFEDMDNDRCLEIIINGVYAAWSYDADPLLYIDFSQTKAKKKYQIVSCKGITDTEIIRYNNQLLYFGLMDDADNHRFTSIHIINLPNHQGLISLHEIKPISPDMQAFIQKTSHQRFNDDRTLFGPERKHLSFSKTGRNLSDAGKPITLQSKRLPKLKICPLYNALNPDLTPSEKLYHSQRNEFLRTLITKLDTEWNPFPDSLDNPFPSLLFNEGNTNITSQQAYQKLDSVVDVIPIFSNQKKLIVVVFNIHYFEEDDQMAPNTVLMLYDATFNYLGYQPIQFPHPLHSDADLNLPLPQEKFIFASYDHAPRYSSFLTFMIEDNSIKETLFYPNISSSDVFLYQNDILVHIKQNNHYLATSFGDAGNGVGFMIDYIKNPKTGKSMDKLFPEYFQNKLEYLYYVLHFFHYVGKDAKIVDNYPAERIERYEKTLYYPDLLD